MQPPQKLTIGNVDVEIDHIFRTAKGKKGCFGIRSATNSSVDRSVMETNTYFFNVNTTVLSWNVGLIKILDNASETEFTPVCFIGKQLIIN
jgi:hypothetical protein